MPNFRDTPERVYHQRRMAQAIGTASVAFGLVSIPVRIHSANRTTEQISFNLLHGRCGSRLKQQYVCAQEGEKVERADMVKGYEFAKGRYVVLSEDEIKALESAGGSNIEIESFVPAESVDPIYFDKPYYLSPGKGGDRAYALLVAAMRKTGRWAIGRYSARGKQHVVALRPGPDDAMVMQQLRYADELKTVGDLELPDVELKDQELKMAVQLAELASADAFDPSAYNDESKSKMRDLIERKIAGEEIAAAPEEPQGEVIDLMAALRASLERAPKKEADAPRRERKPAQRAPKKAGGTTRSRGVRSS